jgi:RNA polymerase sigma-70 factor (ECF subfamily)
VTDTGNDSLDEIIQGCLKKKEKSQEMLYKRFFGYALRVALIYNRNRENALEVVNDSFMKIFDQIGRYDTSLPFKSWLSKIVVNTSIDRFRKNNRDLVLDEKETFLVPDETHNVVNKLSADDILGLLNRLPEVHRLVFSLYEIEGYSHDEISSLLKIPESSSRVYLTRAKKRLRELFGIFFSASYEKYGN